MASTGATHACMATRVAALSRQTSQVPEPPHRMLPAPLIHFDIEQPPTHVTWDEYHNEKKLCGWCYSVGLEVEIGDTTWIQVTVTVPSGLKGYLLMPPHFYRLGRRLLWGALFFENIWEIWEDMATDVATDAFLREHEETIQHSRRASAMWLMWYMHCRRRIVYEILKTDYDAWSDDMPNPYEGFNAFIEFGIRDYCSWMFHTFEGAQEEEEHFLALDPTAPENLDAFSAHGNAPALNTPPDDDNWLNTTWSLPGADGISLAELRERLIFSSINEPREEIPMGEEGDEYMVPAFQIWESESRSLYPLSAHYIDFFCKNDISPGLDTKKYCMALIDLHRTDIGVSWPWEWYALSVRCGHHDEDEELVYLERTVLDLDAKRIMPEQFYMKIFYFDNDRSKDGRPLTPPDSVQRT
ncbi:hypothetical protein H0H81_002994 [Sphagnurus paluster]|uniref:Uncharacterized protein n=1 Tax=Sphagnurus paluster TaxID=117069 RepID=A0A9P7KEW2_9AGAR|nr:hypothetical protein H0H81_002994 [Sphagnurus paluster]